MPSAYMQTVKPKSACTSIQVDQGLHWPLIYKLVYYKTVLDIRGLKVDPKNIVSKQK